MQKKLMIVSSLLFILGLVSVTTLAADKNMTSILEDWFDKQENEAIEEIDASIEEVRIEQTERLKTTLQEMIAEQEADLDEVVETETAMRTNALKDYADELVEDIKAEHSDASESVELPTEELDAITEDAKQQMKAVIEQEVSEGTSQEDKETEVPEEDKEDEVSEEAKEAESEKGEKAEEDEDAKDSNDTSENEDKSNDNKGEETEDDKRYEETNANEDKQDKPDEEDDDNNKA